MRTHVAHDLLTMTAICAGAGAMFAVGVRLLFRRGKRITEP